MISYLIWNMFDVKLIYSINIHDIELLNRQCKSYKSASAHAISSVSAFSETMCL